MKILHVRSDNDYAATSFEADYNGTPVSEIIQRVEAGEEIDKSGEEQYVVKLYEFEHVPAEFIEFVRTEVQDYDHSKHENFYVEGTTV